jgi:hypothetical protein
MFDAGKQYSQNYKEKLSKDSMNVSVSFAKTFYKLDVSYSLPAFSTT